MNYVFSFIYLFIYLFIYFQTEIGKRNRVYCRNYVAIWTLSAGFTNVNNITNLFSYNPFYIERSYALTVALNSPGAMVPLHLICLYCLQPFFFEHLFNLYYQDILCNTLLPAKVRWHCALQLIRWRWRNWRSGL